MRHNSNSAAEARMAAVALAHDQRGYDARVISTVETVIGQEYRVLVETVDGDRDSWRIITVARQDDGSWVALEPVERADHHPFDG